MSSSRNLSAEEFNKLYSIINQRCFLLINSVELNSKLAGIIAIDKILDVLGNDPTRSLRLAASIQRAFPCNDPFIMNLAAKVFARLAIQSGSLMVDHVQIQIKSCIEWLQGERLENRRYCAVLILRQLTKNNSFLIFDHVLELLDNLWTALRDPKVSSRPTFL